MEWQAQIRLSVQCQLQRVSQFNLNTNLLIHSLDIDSNLLSHRLKNNKTDDLPLLQVSLDLLPNLSLRNLDILFLASSP